MAIDLPISNPLTDAQAELTAKVGSMKSLLALPTLRKRNIPKDQQISAYDFLLKLFETMGLNPEIIFNSFLTKIFDETGTFLEDKVLDAIGDSIGENGIILSPYTNNPSATDKQKKEFKAQNKEYIRSLVGSTIPTAFLQVVKQEIAKNLVIMIFGPKNGPGTTALNPNQSQVDGLIQNAVCAEGLFSLSSDLIVRNQDLEYNRIRLRQQLEKGEVVYEISCQDVKIKLPEDPGFIFNGGGTFTTSSSTITPAQSLVFTVQYVNNQVQRINNETNANKGGKKFHQILIEKLISLISVLVQPYLSSVFDAINSLLNPTEHLDYQNFIFDNCAIANDPDSSNKKEFAKSLFNALLKDLLKLLLIFGIKQFKRLVKNFFARTAIEKQRRRLEKNKQKFQIFQNKTSETLDKAQRYRAALETLATVLGII